VITVSKLLDMSAIFREYIFYRRSHVINMYDTEIYCRQEGKSRAIFVLCSSTHVNLKGVLGYGMSQLTILRIFQSKLGLGEDF